MFLLAEDIKIFGTKFATDVTLPQPDMDSIRGWCAANSILTKSHKQYTEKNTVNRINKLSDNPYQLRKNISVLFGTTFFFFSHTKLWHSYINMGDERDVFCPRGLQI